VAVATISREDISGISRFRCSFPAFPRRRCSRRAAIVAASAVSGNILISIFYLLTPVRAFPLRSVLVLVFLRNCVFLAALIALALASAVLLGSWLFTFDFP